MILASHEPSLEIIILICKVEIKPRAPPASQGCCLDQMGSQTLKEHICPLRKVDVCEESHLSYLESFPIQGQVLALGK